MNYCNWKDITVKIVRKYPDPNLIPEDSQFVIGKPKKEHNMPNWYSIGLKFTEELPDWCVLVGNADNSGYRALWDVYSKDKKQLEKELKKSCEWLGGKYSKGYTRTKGHAVVRCHGSLSIDFEGSRKL